MQKNIFSQSRLCVPPLITHFKIKDWCLDSQMLNEGVIYRYCFLPKMTFCGITCMYRLFARVINPVSRIAVFSANTAILKHSRYPNVFLVANLPLRDYNYMHRKIWFHEKFTTFCLFVEIMSKIRSHSCPSHW